MSSWPESMKQVANSVGRDNLKQQLASQPAVPIHNNVSHRNVFGEFLQGIPPFHLRTARLMLSSDPIVRFALNVRNAALATAEVNVTAKSERVKLWVEKQWKTLWNNYRPALLSAKKWGFAALQVTYTLDRYNLLNIDRVIDMAPEDTRALTHESSVVGVKYRGEKMHLPRVMWISFDAESGSPYGTGCLRRSYPAWHTKWSDHGAENLLKIRMIKDSYVGDIFWYPPDMVAHLPDGTALPWRDVFREMAENRMSGSAMTLPMLKDKDGNKLVEYQPPTDVAGSSQIFEWHDSLNEAILRGADVPIEVVKASETGSGFSGRSIPFMVVLSVCNQELVEIVQGAKDVLRMAAWLNFGGDPEFEINPKSLVESFASDASGSAMGGGAIGGQSSGGMVRPQQIQQAQPSQQQESAQFDEGVIESIAWKGLSIAIECKAGNRRKPHYEPLCNDYGYIRQTSSKDGDSIDVFIGDNLESEIVFVVDQPRESGRFDEHKVMIGFNSKSEAEAAFRSNYPPAWKIGSITPMTVDQFKAWLLEGNTNKPVESQVSQFDEAADSNPASLISAPLLAARSRIRTAAEAIRALKKNALTIEEVYSLVTREIDLLQPLIGADLAAAMFGAEITGMAEIAAMMPGTLVSSPRLQVTLPPIKPPPPPKPSAVLFPEGPPPGVRFPAMADAIEVLTDSPVAAGANYRETAELVKQGAFAVTGDLKESAVADIREILARTIEDGGTVEDFTEEVIARLESGGPLSEARLENIFRTQTATALSNGQDKSLKQPMVVDAFPYRAYFATTDQRVRKNHMALEKLGLNGTNIYRADDPTWLKFRPPWEYACRCQWSPVTVEQAADRGVEEARAWWARAKAMVEQFGGNPYDYLNRTAPIQGETVSPPAFEPPPGFTR